MQTPLQSTTARLIELEFTLLDCKILVKYLLSVQIQISKVNFNSKLTQNKIFYTLFGKHEK